MTGTRHGRLDLLDLLQVVVGAEGEDLRLGQVRQRLGVGLARPPACAWYVASSSPTICSSKSERITIAAAPASSRRRTESRSSTSGEEPGISGCGSAKPRYVVERSMVTSLRRRDRAGAAAGARPADAARASSPRGACRGAGAAPPPGRLGRRAPCSAPGRPPRASGSGSRCCGTSRTGIFGAPESSTSGASPRGDAARVEAVERPDARVHGELLLLAAEGHVVAVRDAVAVRDHERRAGVGLGLLDGLDGLEVLRAERDPRDVDVAVAHRHQAEVLLAGLLAGDGELGGGAERRRLRLLASRVRVDLGVEHEHVDVVGQREHVVEAAEADVVGPAVAADDPDGLLDEVVAERRRACRAAGAVERRELAGAAAPRARAGPRSPASVDWSASRISRARPPAERRAAARRAAAARARRGCRAPGACRGRTPRCPRRGSSTRPGPRPSRSTV